MSLSSVLSSSHVRSLGLRWRAILEVEFEDPRRDDASDGSADELVHQVDTTGDEVGSEKPVGVELDDGPRADCGHRRQHDRHVGEPRSHLDVGEQREFDHDCERHRGHPEVERVLRDPLRADSRHDGGEDRQPDDFGREHHRPVPEHDRGNQQNPERADEEHRPDRLAVDDADRDCQCEEADEEPTHPVRVVARYRFERVHGKVDGFHAIEGFAPSGRLRGRAFCSLGTGTDTEDTLMSAPSEKRDMNVLPDTSVVIDGRISERVEDGDFEGATVLVPEAVVAELEAQANSGAESGWDGLSELQRLADLADEETIELKYVGERPDATEKGLASEGEIDALIRDLAAEHDAVFVTSDVVQSEVAEAKGVEVEYISPRTDDDSEIGRLSIEEYFDDQTMSVHLRSGLEPKAKRGDVGDMHYQQIRDEVTSEEDVREIAQEIIDGAKESNEGFIELNEPGMTIVQFRDYRIAIAEPPFADAWEITAVRPIVKTDMEDYEYADELKERLLEHQRGVLIAGSPGAGKSTFAQAVGEFLAENDFAVKTMEKPRDLQVGPEITQYTELGGEMEKTADSLLMVRPDYTIYDEVRKTDDFEVFADMRLAGVGMIGVVHATRAIDALQRLVGRVELGMIPQIVDTVVYIEAGEINKVYDVSTQVKVPEGLMEEDLARPVIMIQDFETGRPEYEIYTFNRQVVTVPLNEGEREESGVSKLAKQEIEREIQSVARGAVDVEVQGQNRATVYVTEDDISYVIGKGGGRIEDIENRLGIDIDVRTHDEKPQSASSGSSGAGGAGAGGSPGEVVTPEITSRHIVLPTDGHSGETVEVEADGEYLFTATVGRGGDIQVSRGSAIAEELERAIDRERQIRVVRS